MNERIAAATSLILLALSTHADARRSAPPAPVWLAPPAEISSPALWIDVRQPARVKGVFQDDAWLAEEWQRPLGRGFLGSWGAFLGTRGEDVRATFKGAVADLALGALFAQPFRIAWWTSPDETYAPALVVPRPGEAFRLAFAALDHASRQGAVSTRCTPGSPDLLIGRWLLAEQAVFVARREDRVVLARHPAAVLQASCGPLPDLGAGADLSVTVDPERFSRGAQLASAVAGLSGPLRFDFHAESNRLVAAGLAAPLDRPERLAVGPASSELLSLLPASVPVVLSARLQLPESLDPASLGAFWKGASATTVRRDATVAWWPRGDGRAGFEVALLWSRQEDDAALLTMFDGKNALAGGTMCNHVVLASSTEVFQRLRRACSGEEPSFQDLGDSVRRGFAADASLQVVVQPGLALPALLRDGYRTEQVAPVPKEIEDAARELSALPILGFSGAAQAKALVPRGFGT